MRTLWRIFAGFFKWTWRLLNFVRNLVMNIFFIFLVLVCAGIWMHLSSASQAREFDARRTAPRYHRGDC